MSPELKESRSTTCLELEIACCTSLTQDCEVFVELETAPSETVDSFGTKDFVALKDKGLVLAT